MNIRLVSKNKALNISLVKHSGKYHEMKLDIQAEKMKRDIHMLYKKYINRPKLREKILNMMGMYKELLLDEIMLILVNEDMIKEGD